MKKSEDIISGEAYRKRPKLRERKVLQFNGICHDVGKTIRDFASI